MLNEFYNFIAKKVYSFFQTSALEGTLLKGESFCFKLDNDEMVIKVTQALEKHAEENNAKGEYVHSSGYKTFTIKVENDEVIVGSQINGITDDFLGATLRNAANNARKPLLMISSNPIDSAKSGSRDMAASGMPFYADRLMSEIKEKIDESTQLTNTEKRILQFELRRRDADVFSDKASIYEYRDLLSIISSGRIDVNNYRGFRLFSVDGKVDYQNDSNQMIDKEIKENHQLFEKIDRGLRFGNLESEVAMIFEDNIVVEIQKEYKKSPENWSTVFQFMVISL